MRRIRDHDTDNNAIHDVISQDETISLIAERDVLIAECSDLSGRLARLRETHSFKMRQRFEELKVLTDIVEHQSTEIAKLQCELKRLKRSSSWRITSPLRALRRYRTR